ncbi:MAG: hypothetical protein R8M45_03570 [Ghiorsea sp.]
MPNKQQIQDMYKAIAQAEKKCQQTQELLDEALLKIEQLKVVSPAIQDRLNLLEALECGGVRNWEWFDESVEAWAMPNDG